MNVYTGINAYDHVFFSEDPQLSAQSTIAINGELLPYVGSGSWAKELSNGRIITAGYNDSGLSINWQGSDASSSITVNTITIDTKVYHFKG